MSEKERACRWCINCDENSDGYFGPDVEAVCLVGNAREQLKDADLDKLTECKSWSFDPIFLDENGEPVIREVIA